MDIDNLDVTPPNEEVNEDNPKKEVVPTLKRIGTETDEELDQLLLDHCCDVYRSKMDARMSTVKAADDFYEMHTQGLFLTFQTFSENFVPTATNVKVLVKLSQSIRSKYEDYKSVFNEQQVSLDEEFFNQLDEALDMYDKEMEKKCTGVSPEVLASGNQEASNTAQIHLEQIRSKSELRWENAREQLDRNLKLKFEFFKRKNGHEAELDKECFQKFGEALDVYEKNMQKRPKQDFQAHEESSELAKLHLNSMKISSELRWKHASELLRKSLNMQLNFEDMDDIFVTTAIAPEDVWIDLNALLGQGGFGKVYRGWMDSLSSVAVKTVAITGSQDEINRNRDKFSREVRHMKQAGHVNVVRVEGYVLQERYMAMVMEYMYGGNLHDVLLSKDPNTSSYKIENLDFALRLRFCSDISCGVTYLHNGFTDQRMVHGDIKPLNILLTDDLRCKVSDFGGADFGTCSAVASTQSLLPKTRLECTKGFNAPERKPDVRVSPAMDVYSVGATFYVVLSRVNPDKDVDDFQNTLKNFIETNSADELFQDSQEVFDLLKNVTADCCQRDAESRPKMIDVRDKLLKSLHQQDFAVIADKVADIIKIRPIKMPDVPKSEHKKLCDLPMI